MTVENGKEAIEAARARHFDFVITDLVMPELNGWEVLEILLNTQPPPRVIIVTAYGGEDIERRVKEKGALAYVKKPYIIDPIKKILREALKEEVGSNSN